MTRNGWLGRTCIAFAACAGEAGDPGADGASALIVDAEEPAGAHCAHGGRRIATGLDRDGDGVLDADEIERTSFVCHGSAGEGAPGTLLAIENEPPGPNCEAGGYRILTGTDVNGDGTLQPTEVSASEYLCNGTDGADGVDGRDSLIRSEQVEPGEECEFGGTVIRVGVDRDGDGQLASNEVTDSVYFCNQYRCDAPRFSRDGAIACPLDAGPFAEFSTNGIRFTATASGDLFALHSSGGSGETTMLRIAPDGTITNPYWTSSLGPGMAGGLSAIGDDLYVAHWTHADIFAGRVDRFGDYHPLVATPRAGATVMGLAAADDANVFLLTGSTVVRSTGLNEPLVPVAPGQANGPVWALHFDPVESRLYWNEGGSIYYLDLPLADPPEPRHLATIEGDVIALTTDSRGRVYAACGVFDVVMTIHQACEHGLWRVDKDGTGLVSLIDDDRLVMALAWHGDSKTLHLVFRQLGFPYQVERLRILD